MASKEKPKTILSGEDIAKENKSNNPEGRPTKRTAAIESELFERLAAGESLRSVCRDDHIPSNRTIFSWMHADDEFLRRYERAKEQGCDAMAEELFEIADDSTNDYMEKENKDGSVYEAVNGENIQRSRLRIDTRKWYLSKIRAKKYGEKLDVSVTKKYEDMTEEEIDAQIARLQAESNKD